MLGRFSSQAPLKKAWLPTPDQPCCPGHCLVSLGGSWQRPQAGRAACPPGGFMVWEGPHAQKLLPPAFPL